MYTVILSSDEDNPPPTFEEDGAMERLRTEREDSDPCKFLFLSSCFLRGFYFLFSFFLYMVLSNTNTFLTDQPDESVECAISVSAEGLDPPLYKCPGYDPKPLDGESSVLGFQRCGVLLHYLAQSAGAVEYTDCFSTEG